MSVFSNLAGTQPSRYDLAYYSGEHIAYPEGYTLETRRVKYSDVVENIVHYMRQPWLDAGCGPGYLVHLLREKNFPAFGCDFSETAVQMADEFVKPFVRKGDLRHLPFSDEEFSSSSAFHVLEHLHESDAISGVRELFRVTKERFYGIIPTTDGITARDIKIRDQVMNDPTHVTLRPRIWWQELFKRCGWSENESLEEQFDRKEYGWVFVFDK